MIEWLNEAAHDPNVVAIKMTVYRTGTDSELMQSLIRAAQNGKEVTVVVELMARFDEEANSAGRRNWRSGAHVVYGVVGLQSPCQSAADRAARGGTIAPLRAFGHGNYHPKTARLYSDFGLLTANPRSRTM